MELSELGEFGLISRINTIHKNTRKDTIFGIGDDAAVLTGEQGSELLISTDILIEGVHFDLSYSPLKHVGYKAVVSNISDICAMNGKATHIVVSLGISNRFSVEAIEELYEGISAACKNYSVDLVGGDTSTSPKGMVINITVLGKAAIGKTVYRSGAKAKDILCVTGDLGAAYMGLQLLRREKEVFLTNPHMQPELHDKEYVVGRQLRPEARADVIAEFEERSVRPTSMIDISDGLASEIWHLGKRSGLKARIFQDKLPIDEQTMDTADEFGISATTAVLYGGEDYELLFTLDPSDYDKVKNHPDITTIGYMLEEGEGVELVLANDDVIEVPAAGFVHF